MKWVVLAGGTWSRLFPVTKWVNKHLLPVWGKPMIFYPIKTLVDAGIREILIITAPDAIWPLSKQLWSGQDFIAEDGKQIQILYGIQNKPLGIAHALWISRFFVGDDDCAVILWDNVFDDNISEEIKQFTSGAKVFLKEVHDPERFWIAEIDWSKIISVEEKPKQPKSNLAITGLYIFDNTVFEKIDRIQPSWRNELEITDVNDEYLKEWKLEYANIDGIWYDAWNFEALHKINCVLNDKNLNK